MKEDNIHDILEKGKNMEMVEKISGFQELEEREEWLAGVYGFLRQWNYPVWYYNIDICLYTFVKTHRMFNAKSGP